MSNCHNRYMVDNSNNRQPVTCNYQFSIPLIFLQRLSKSNNSLDESTMSPEHIYTTAIDKLIDKKSIVKCYQLTFAMFLKSSNPFEKCSCNCFEALHLP